MMAPLQSPPASHQLPWVTNNASDSEPASCPGGYTDDRRHCKQTTWAGSGAGVDGAACCTHGSWIGRTVRRWTPDRPRQPLPFRRHHHLHHHCWESALWQIVVAAAWDGRNLRKGTDQFALTSVTVSTGWRQALHLHSHYTLGTTLHCFGDLDSADF